MSEHSEHSEHGEEELNITSAFKKVLKTAYNHVKACLGAKETLKSLLREEKLELVILTKDLTQKYQDLILSFCKKTNTPVFFMETRQELGNVYPVKVKKAGAIAIKDFVNETTEKQFILQALK
ncbi:hypothetical protein EHP00_1273 [Ecytonucleospora hepatopenaei]|uniref:Ribosomal protein eL8/eL30/eS12/Gadd45 domain-containing protein n=1 Tax=Ecytonucleospora hepatopenaei TaxID=646526 RepID=A0A1W0E6A6_9MICR|nr:hypothetical protein EHP00_1273 [Ecytonucleospora hepatopenaei]